MAQAGDVHRRHLRHARESEAEGTATGGRAEPRSDAERVVEGTEARRPDPPEQLPGLAVEPVVAKVLRGGRTRGRYELRQGRERQGRDAAPAGTRAVRPSATRTRPRQGRLPHARGRPEVRL